jgi:hypothetical protein
MPYLKLRYFTNYFEIKHSLPDERKERKKP